MSGKEVSNVSRREATSMIDRATWNVYRVEEGRGVYDSWIGHTIWEWKVYLLKTLTSGYNYQHTCKVVHSCDRLM